MTYKQLSRILFSAFVLCTAQSYGQSNVVWGNSNSRTDYRDNAGLQGNAGAISGFFETESPNNYPSGASSWWHLLDVRHNNQNNNYAMQLSGSFFDQELYFRKTNGNPSQPWTKVVLEDHLQASLGTIAQNYTPNTGNWTTSGTTLRLNGQDYTTIGFHDSGNRVDFIRAGNGIIQLGYNGGWGEASLGMPGGGMWSNNGNVGIGMNPDSKLSVNGTIHTREVRIDTQNFPDFVFKPTYTLPSLKEVKNYIDQKGHLPGMPSEAEAIKEGLNLGEMNKKLLQKVEELTLYLIEKDKSIKSLTARQTRSEQQHQLDIRNLKDQLFKFRKEYKRTK